MTSLTVFNADIAQSLYESTELYPVNFDDAWVWLGYARKDSAKRVLVKEFVENEDYRLHNTVESAPSGGLTHREDIFLTANCLKEMGMMAGTEKGKEVRRYFLRCENIVKNLVKTPKQDLLPGDVRVVNFISVLKDLGCDIQNPRFNQELQDFALDVAIGHNRKRIESTNKEVWMGVAERAEQLGYPVGLVTKNRSQLGKFVKANGLNPVKEKRLCNGTQREINLYLVDDALDIAIKEFMDAKTLAA